MVRIDSVGKGQDDTQVMNGAFVLGKTSTRRSTYSYTDVRAPQAEKLARNLRKYADQLKTTPAAR